METIERKTETQTPTPGPTRRRGLLVAAAALVVAIIAAGTVIGFVSGGSEEPDVASLTSGPIGSFEDIAGTYLRQGPGAPTYLLFLEDGTVHAAPDTDLIMDSPVVIYQTRFEGTEVFVTTTDSNCDQPDQGGSYQVHVLEGGNLQFVAVDEDPCELRSAVLQGFGNNDVEFEPVP